jgi:hypothetical protein
MSHFTVVVFTKDRKDPVGDVTRLLAPFDENDEMFREGSFWDWWTVGGRWDGAMRGTEPETIQKQCYMCKGTGVRPGGREQFGDRWFEQTGGCNACGGKGYIEEWANDSNDVVLARNSCDPKDIAQDFTPFGFVTPDGEYISNGTMGWWAQSSGGEDEEVWKQKWIEAKGVFQDTLAVLVDCHV